MSAPSFDFTAPETRFRPRALYRAGGKRLLDLGLVFLAAPVWVPALAILLLAVSFGGGRALYVQDRIGRGGRRFRCWKVRTMVVDADARLSAVLSSDPALAAEWALTQKLARDPRITRLGRFLRRSSLDELPQLWNVIRGDMSLIGPRPFLPEQAGQYAGGRRDAAYYDLRPGLTGLWQISRRNAGSFAERAGYDAAYAGSLSLLSDLRILAGTVGVVLRATGK